MYQQMYKSVPVYDGYYFLHFKSDTFMYANGEYTPIRSVSNTIKLNSESATKIAFNYTSFALYVHLLLKAFEKDLQLKGIILIQDMALIGM